jgi:hypothetical protein
MRARFQLRIDFNVISSDLILRIYLRLVNRLYKGCNEKSVSFNLSYCNFKVKDVYPKGKFELRRRKSII